MTHADSPTVNTSGAACADAHPDFDDAAGLSVRELHLDAHIHEMAEAWAWWCTTRRYFGKPSTPVGTLARLTAPSRPFDPLKAGSTPCSAELHAFHLAVLAQPDALDRQVFEIHYLKRPRNIKAAAAAMSIGRQHWYTLLRAFRRRVWAAHAEIYTDNTRRGARLMAEVG